MNQILKIKDTSSLENQTLANVRSSLPKEVLKQGYMKSNSHGSSLVGD